jgi:large subunit ribosomal protein L30
MHGLLVAVRIKGSVGLDYARRRTLEYLRLKRVHTAVLLSDTPSVRGMLRKVERYVTWGSPSRKTIYTILKRSGVGKVDLEKLGFNSLESLAERLETDPTILERLQLKPARFGPPKGGYKRTIKRPYRYNGEYGVRDEAIDQLVRSIA